MGEEESYTNMTLSNMSGNVTNLADAPGLETPGCVLYDFVMYTVICGTMCVFGIIGNLIAFVVFQMDTLKTSTTFLFQGLSITDSLLLLTAFPSYSLTPLMKYFEIYYFEAQVTPYILVYVFPWAFIAQTAAIWVTVLVGVNRYIAVCLPYQASRLCSVAKARQYLAIVLLFSFAYNIPHFVTKKITYKTVNNKTYPIPEHTDNQVFNIIYYNICYLIFMLLVPLLILTVLNFRLIKTLKELKRRRSEMQSRQQQQDNNVTFVLIIVLLVFTFCQAPALVTQILWSVLSNEQRECGGFQYYYSRLTNALVLLNSAVNFVIYVLFNKRFRQVMVQHVCVCLRDRGKQKANGCAQQTLLTQV